MLTLLICSILQQSLVVYQSYFLIYLELKDSLEPRSHQANVTVDFRISLISRVS
jgi:hypothetical protein